MDTSGGVQTAGVAQLLELGDDKGKEEDTAEDAGSCVLEPDDEACKEEAATLELLGTELDELLATDELEEPALVAV